MALGGTGRRGDGTLWRALFVYLLRREREAAA
jgi:hypothetical protein